MQGEGAQLAAVAMPRKNSIQHAVSLEINPVDTQRHAGIVDELYFARGSLR